MSPLNADAPETPMPTEPDDPDTSSAVDAQIARSTAFELMAVTRAMFGLVDPTHEQAPEGAGAPEELPPASVPVPPLAAPHDGIPLPEAAPLSENVEPEAVPPVASPAMPSVQAPASVPLPDAIPVPDEVADQEHTSDQGNDQGRDLRVRPGRRSLDLLQEIAFLDE